MLPYVQGGEGVKRVKPPEKGCQGFYVPWVCGTCPKIRECKPRQVTR